MNKMKTYALVAMLWIVSSVWSQAYGQITSAMLSGIVTTAENKKLANAQITIYSTENGTSYTTQTNKNGLYSLSNLNAGVPYTLRLLYGQDSLIQEEVVLQLGANELHLSLSHKQTLEEVVVSGKAKKNSELSLSMGQEKINVVPTISRSITDITRLVPSNINNSFGGTNYKYNNVTVDGAINNDAIGFAATLGGSTSTSGMPGSSTRTHPISLDAIQEMQVYTSPYDVKIGNFLGGSVNAVTRSGTNEVKGSVYFFGRNYLITGPNNVTDKSSLPSNFYEFQTGARVGLPILKNKLFYFMNVEWTKRNDPVLYGATSDEEKSKNTSLIDETTAKGIADFVSSNYGFDVGSYKDYAIYSQSTKIFNRIDWYISKNHHLTVRNNTTLGEATNLERSTLNFRFSGIDYKQSNHQISTVMELKSRFGSHFSNSFILGYSSIDDFRTPSSKNDSFPQVEITHNGGLIVLGSDREASVFNLKQRTLEITNNLNWNVGKHSLTLGTHNELYTIFYGFVNAWNGRVSYKSLDDFYHNKPNRVRGSYSFENNSRDYLFNHPYANYTANLLSAYAEDRLTLSKKIHITFGIRFDWALVPQKPKVNKIVSETPASHYAGKTYTSTPMNQLKGDFLGQTLVSPRVGFTYDVFGNKALVLKGGTGIFTGRIPFAWLSYAYYNDGVGFGSFDVSSASTGNPLAQGARQFALNSGSNKGLVQVDLVDNGFQMPQVWRSNLIIEYNLHDYHFSLEGTFTKVLKDVRFQQINLVDTPKYANFDLDKQMPIYNKSAKINPQFSNAYLLSNTDQGYRYNIIFKVTRNFRFPLSASFSYYVGQSFDLAPGARTSMESNWQMHPALSPNNPQLAYSNFDIRHRLLLMAAYKFTWNKKHATSAQLVFSAQSGSPFSWGFIGSNTIGNAGQNVGLAYVFKDLDEALPYFAPTEEGKKQAQAFMDYVNADDYLKTRKGHYTERNGARTPWNINADIKFLHEFKFWKKQSIQLSLDIMNLTNLLFPEWGRVYFVPNTNNATSSIGLAVESIANPAQPQFSFKAPKPPYVIDQLASRWQMQLGVRYIF